MAGHGRAWRALATAAVALCFTPGIGAAQGGQKTTIHFSGYTWTVKSSARPVGPGPNLFSDSSANVWVDDKQRLHLKITKTQGKWRCAEVVCTKSPGYGVYRFYLDSPVDRLDPNVVLGLFTWSDAPAFHHREIDIELSRWAKPEDKNAQFVVQPYTTPRNIQRFPQPPDLPQSTHLFRWQRDSILFQSLRGLRAAPSSPDDIIAQWTFSPPDIPEAGGETPRLNLWLFRGSAPQDGQEVEVIVHRFEFVPSPGSVSGAITLQGCLKPAQPVNFIFRPLDGSPPFTRRQTLTDDGKFAFNDIPVNAYKVAIKGAKWLQKVVSVDMKGGSASGVTATLLAGDVNNDNRVDLKDLGLMADAFGSTPADMKWNDAADLNCDGKVDKKDQELLAANINKRGDP
jgi:hypothetical protein